MDADINVVYNKDVHSIGVYTVYGKITDLNILKDNKVYLLPNSFFKYLESESSIIDLSYNYEDLSSFINYFYKIYEKYILVMVKI